MRVEPRDEAAQGGLVADAQAEVADPRGRMRRQLERVPFVVAPAAEIDRIARAPGLMETDDRGEERQALLGLRREQLDVAEVGDIAEAGKGIVTDGAVI